MHILPKGYSIVKQFTLPRSGVWRSLNESHLQTSAQHRVSYAAQADLSRHVQSDAAMCMPFVPAVIKDAIFAGLRIVHDMGVLARDRPVDLIIFGKCKIIFAGGAGGTKHFR